MTDIFEQLVQTIIREQEGIIGPLALEQAKQVDGLHIDLQQHKVLLEGNKKDIVEHLIERFRDFFGQASVEVCRDASKKIILQLPKEEIPPLLQ